MIGKYTVVHEAHSSLEPQPEWPSPLFGNPAIRYLTRGFASQPHDWFAFIGEESEIICFFGSDDKAMLVPKNRPSDVARFKAFVSHLRHCIQFYEQVLHKLLF